MTLATIISLIVYAFLILEEIIDLPHRIFGSVQTPVNYHEIFLESALLVLLLICLLMFYNKELTNKIEYEKMLHHMINVEKERSEQLLSIGYRYHHECQTPLVTLSGYMESISKSCDDTRCPFLKDKKVILSNIKKLHKINKTMSEEINKLCESG